MDISNRLYKAASVRELDRRAIQEHGIPGIVLMKRAGMTAFDMLQARWPTAQAVVVFCGGGNNGGDGYIIAGRARQRGWRVHVAQLAAPEKLKGDARLAWQFAVDQDVEMHYFGDDSAQLPAWLEQIEAGLDDVSRGDDSRDSVVMVDALLGTGITGEVRPAYRDAIKLINRLTRPVLAVDIPSGLCSDSGAVKGLAVCADMTVTFIGIKSGLYTGRGPALSGEVVFRDLDVPSDVYVAMEVAAEKLDLSGLLAAELPQRERDAHKGHFGHVLVIGGDTGFGGAAAMAGESALRVGAGLVGVATRGVHVQALLARRPELMVKTVESGQDLGPLLSGPTVLVIGPGLGRAPWGEQVLQQAVQSGLPMVLDADALNILGDGLISLPKGGAGCVLTPHPGEAARLLGVGNADIQRERFAAARALREKYGATVLLKGAGTLIDGGDDRPVGLCPYGNPGMASGGMGDVLAGIIGGLMAQGLAAPLAARLGACLHGVAADRVASESGERGMAATDLLRHLPALVNGR